MFSSEFWLRFFLYRNENTHTNSQFKAAAWNFYYGSFEWILVIFSSILTINFGHYIVLSFSVSKVIELVNFSFDDRTDRKTFSLAGTVWNEHESVANCKLKYDTCFLIHFTVWNGLFIAVFIREIYEEAQFIDQYRSAASSSSCWNIDFWPVCIFVRRH